MIEKSPALPDARRHEKRGMAQVRSGAAAEIREFHFSSIRELRRKGQTYRDLSRLFQERLGLYVAPSTLHSFVKVRAKHRKRSQFEVPPASPVMDHVAALKTKPVARSAKPVRFVFRENGPLTLTSSGGDQ